MEAAMTKDDDDYDPNRELKDEAEARQRGGSAVEQALGGSNPVGVAAGAVAGLAVGAVGGLAAGPVGSAVGAVAGAVLGAMAGGAADTAAGVPLADDSAWREHHTQLPTDTPRYVDLEPAYRIGDAAGDSDWDEARLSRLWDEGGSPLPWAQARPAARHAWELARQRTGTAPPAGVRPGQDSEPGPEAR
jgi:hypothetical protein